MNNKSRMEKVVEIVQFDEMGIDDRILESVACLGWKEPTLIQEKAIPYVLEGKDVLARARTGSGKTGAFLIPILHRILEDKAVSTVQTIKALILAPTKELCKQITRNVGELTKFCCREIRFVDISPRGSLDVQKPMLNEIPDIVIGTPNRVLAHLNGKSFDIKESLQFLVMDEADLMLAYESKSDIQEILIKLPKIYQSFLTSATITTDLKDLKKIVMHNPVVLRLKEPPLPTEKQLLQYVIKLEEFDKAVLLYAMFRLNMIKGKTIIFVNGVNRCYKLRMFLGQFDIRSCVLNCEMPMTSRCHIIDQFNLDKYDIIIASDGETLEEQTQPVKQKGKWKHSRDKEFGASRGIDFQFVSNIINFDFPSDVDAYIHRVGRTARGDNQGTSLSLIACKEMEIFQQVDIKLMGLMGTTKSVFHDFKFDMQHLDGFRYRAKDAWQRCTTIAIKETRKKEIRQELLNSAKLQSFFQENPRDLVLLRHDKAEHSLESMPHLRHIPDYIVPKALQKESQVADYKIMLNKTAHQKKVSKKQKPKPVSKAAAKFLRKEADPLRNLTFSGFKHKKT